MSRLNQPARGLKLVAATAALTAALTLTGCGFNVQTLQSYTPANGVNFEDTQQGLYVRNLLIIANNDGLGRLSASITSRTAKDALTAITGTAIKADGTDGSPLTFGDATVDLAPGRLAVLTGEGAPTITVSGADLKPGLTARLTLTFASGQSRTLLVPVVDGALPMYASAAPELKG